MKGGTTTLVLLTAICSSAVDSFASEMASAPADRCHFYHSILSSLLLSQEVVSRAYATMMDSLPSIMRDCAKSLTRLNLDGETTPSCSGHIFHIGYELAGAMACIDTSEMPDTYGAPFDETRAFVAGGWGALGTQDLSRQSPLHRIDIVDFLSDVFPRLTPRDTILFSLCLDQRGVDESTMSSINDITQQLATKGVKFHLLLVALTYRRDTNCQITSRVAEVTKKLLTYFPDSLNICNVELPLLLQSGDSNTDFDSNSVVKSSGLMLNCVLAMKMVMNAVSTFAQGAGRGAIFKVPSPLQLNCLCFFSIFKIYLKATSILTGQDD